MARRSCFLCIVTMPLTYSIANGIAARRGPPRSAARRGRLVCAASPSPCGVLEIRNSLAVRAKDLFVCCVAFAFAFACACTCDQTFERICSKRIRICSWSRRASRGACRNVCARTTHWMHKYRPCNGPGSNYLPVPFHGPDGLAARRGRAERARAAIGGGGPPAEPWVGGWVGGFIV